jgi:undecaprenyl-diphosphatase
MLGLLQGPTELLPISSSGHTTLIPWLLDWPYAELDPELRKSFEVALHAGAGAALAIDMRGELVAATRKLDCRRVAVIALSLAPPVLAGYLLERPIERRLGGPRSIAAGLIAGALAMAAADLRPGRRGDPRRKGCRSRGGDPQGEGTRGEGSRGKGSQGEDPRGARREEEAGPRDGLALGLAQAIALIPGVSRNGATLTAARARGFAREDAQALSWHAGLPVILGASALKGARLLRRDADTRDAGARRAYGAARSHGGTPTVLVVGGTSAFLATLASARLLRRPRVGERPLLAYAIYRCTIAAVTLARLRRTQNRGA